MILGLCLLVFATAVLAIGKFELQLGTSGLQTLSVGAIVSGSQATIYAIRPRRHLWGLRPTKWLVLSSMADILIISTPAVCGIAMAPLPLSVIEIAGLRFGNLHFSDLGRGAPIQDMQIEFRRRKRIVFGLLDGSMPSAAQLLARFETSGGLRRLLRANLPVNTVELAFTHGNWRTAENITLEDLVVALADNCWKGKRVGELEARAVELLSFASGKPAWTCFSDLDEILESLAQDADERLAWQVAYSTQPADPGQS